MKISAVETNIVLKHNFFALTVQFNPQIVMRLIAVLLYLLINTAIKSNKIKSNDVSKRMA